MMMNYLIGVTYAEFDNIIGPQLKYTYPLSIMSKETFEIISDYVILTKNCCEKLIIVIHEDIQFLNYSIAIDNIKYHRNTLSFSFGFILPRGK